MIADVQQETHKDIKHLMKIFAASSGTIRPHPILCGASGSGKSFLIKSLANELNIDYMEVNAAQLTKEGTSGNSLSKALSPLALRSGKPCIVFVDEFDKLFISGNTNSSLAHETTNGVQNEFLKVLESDEADVFGDYGKYLKVPVDQVLFIFAGAFNGEPNIDVNRLREFGIKTEFIGRVGLVYNLERLTADDLVNIMQHDELLTNYLRLFNNVDEADCIKTISKHIRDLYEHNTLGARLVHTLLHQYFIRGGKVNEADIKKIAFTKKLDFKNEEEWGK
jgi:ATP-dependent protease Clp ATPase subunit